MKKAALFAGIVILLFVIWFGLIIVSLTYMGSAAQMGVIIVGFALIPFIVRSAFAMIFKGEKKG